MPSIKMAQFQIKVIHRFAFSDGAFIAPICRTAERKSLVHFAASALCDGILIITVPCYFVVSKLTVPSGKRIVSMLFLSINIIPQPQRKDSR